MRKLWLVLIASIFGVAAYTVAFGITAISTSDLSNDAPISDSIDTKFLFPKLVVAMVPVKPIIKTKSFEGTKNDSLTENSMYDKADDSATNTTSFPNSTFQPSGEPYDFAACLLMKDDNVILPEWLAYHYQVLPLRHLIIGLDPFSLTSPNKIVEEYRKEGMDITIWNEDNFIFNGKNRWNRRVFANNSHDDKVAGYLWRQRAFMTRCIQEFNRRGVRWTTFIDTDEYLVYNHYHQESEDYKCLSPKAPFQFCHDSVFRDSIRNGTHLRNRLPSVGEKTVARFLFELQQEHHPIIANAMKPCIVFPRVLVGPEESLPKYVFNHSVYGLDPMSFHALRYRKFKNKRLPYTGKSVMDAMGYSGRDRIVNNPHKIFPSLCTGKAFPDFSSALLKVIHYTGSFETFARHRGNNFTAIMQMWNNRAVWKSAGADDDIQGWLKLFVSKVGLERAKQLTLKLSAWAIDNDSEIFGSNNAILSTNVSASV